MIQKTISQYIHLQKKIKENQNLLSQMRKEEILLGKEIRTYLNETNETGLRIDNEQIISLISNEKKINLSQKSYKEKLQELLTSKNIYSKTLVDEILNAKTDQIVQEQKLKLMKKKF